MTDDLERRLREDAKAGVGAGSDWSAEECATYWARQCSTARRNAAEAADELARLRAENEALREVLKPFAEACWHLHPAHPDDGETLDGIKVADFRRARLALQEGSRHE